MIRLKGDRWIAIKFVPGTLFIGAFAEHRRANYATLCGQCIEEFHLWICLFPCLPIHYVSASKYENEIGAV